jgi:hypothetical protein
MPHILTLPICWGRRRIGRSASTSDRTAPARAAQRTFRRDVTIDVRAAFGDRAHPAFNDVHLRLLGARRTMQRFGAQTEITGPCAMDLTVQGSPHERRTAAPRSADRRRACAAPPFAVSRCAAAAGCSPTSRPGRRRPLRDALRWRRRSSGRCAALTSAPCAGRQRVAEPRPDPKMEARWRVGKDDAETGVTGSQRLTGVGIGIGIEGSMISATTD